MPGRIVRMGPNRISAIWVRVPELARMRGMNRLIAIGMLVLAAGCNASQMDQTAPEIVGNSWFGAEGKSEAPILNERWTLVEFFAPT